MKVTKRPRLLISSRSGKLGNPNVTDDKNEQTTSSDEKSHSSIYLCYAPTRGRRNRRYALWAVLLTVCASAFVYIAQSAGKMSNVMHLPQPETGSAKDAVRTTQMSPLTITKGGKTQEKEQYNAKRTLAPLAPVNLPVETDPARVAYEAAKGEFKSKGVSFHEIRMPHADFKKNCEVSYWIRSTLCVEIAKHQGKTEKDLPELIPAKDEPIFFHISMNCQAMFRHVAGTGNVLGILYGIRLAARQLGNVHLLVECEDANESPETKFVLPWTTGYFPPRPEFPNIPLERSCVGAIEGTPTQYLIDEIRDDMRRMAIALVGIPSDDHPAVSYVPHANGVVHTAMRLKQQPLHHFPLDDVAIHFRCGDVLESKGHPKMGYVRFSALRKLISPDSDSIGIVTQPFNGRGQNRGGDRGSTRCKLMVKGMQAYLQKEFPSAAVSIRNEESESIATAYSRFVMAKQTFMAGTSTFPIFPILGTFGAGYIRKPDGPAPKSLFGGLLEPPPDEVSNGQVVLVPDQEMLYSSTLMSMWGGRHNAQADKVLEWFTADS